MGQSRRGANINLQHGSPDSTGIVHPMRQLFVKKNGSQLARLHRYCSVELTMLIMKYVLWTYMLLLEMG